MQDCIPVSAAQTVGNADFEHSNQQLVGSGVAFVQHRETAVVAASFFGNLVVYNLL
jgi:hypothetical protein